ncbi:hypothetical protein JCM3765_003708 [Sporobolomyces pararoseus]
MMWTTIGWSLVLNPTASAAQAGPLVLKDNVFNYSIGVQIEIADGFPMEQGKYEPIWSIFQHRYLIYLTLAQKLMREPSAAGPLIPYLNYNVKKLKSYLLTTVSPIHPHISEAFLPTLVIPVPDSEYTPSSSKYLRYSVSVPST